MKKNNSLLPFNEVLTNEVNWGDSLLGRLINSTIRRTRIGFNITKIPNLLEALRGELDRLIASSLQEDSKKIYQILLLKKYFAEIQEICRSSKSEDEKMIELLGKKDNLWDPNKPDRGYWKKTVKKGKLKRCYDEIDKNQNEDSIKKLNLGVDKKDILDALSNFIDDLRENSVISGTSSPPTPTPPAGSTQSGFPQNFNNLIVGINNTPQLVVTSLTTDFDRQYLLSDSVYSFNHFLNEAKGTASSVNIEVKYTLKEKFEQIKSLCNKIGKPDFKQTSEITQNNIAQKLLRLLISLSVVDLEQIAKKNPKFEIKLNGVDKNFKEFVEELLRDSEISGYLNNFQKDSSGRYTPIRKKATDEEIASDRKLPKDVRINELEKRKKSRKNPNDINKLDDYINRLKKLNEKVFVFKDFKILEEYQNKKEVIDLFNEFKSNLGVNELFDITQAEVNKMNSLGTSEAGALVLNLKENPDPIIRIVRIFKRAHDLYFTPLIPSGRSGGKVSNSVFREYILLGKGEGSKGSDTPGYGPWANKKIFDAWRDGVLEILEDQKYRKILANIKFVVPGSEDTFNKESRLLSFDKFEKIFEAESEDKKLSHGQILFNFLNDMLDKETAEDFDKARKNLMAKYFGQFGIEVPKSLPYTPVKEQPTPKENLDPNSLYFKPISTPPPVLTKVGKNTLFDACSSKVYKIELKKAVSNGNVNTIYLQTLKEETFDGQKKGILVKMLLNDGEKLINGIKSKYYSTYQNNCQTNVSPANKKAYFGIMSKINNGIFKIAYASVENNGLGAVETHEIEIQVLSQLHVVDGGKNDKEFNNTFEGLIGDPQEKQKHKDNLEMTDSNNKKLLELLCDKAKAENFKDI